MHMKWTEEAETVHLPLVLTGSAPEELGQSGDGFVVTGVTWGRARQRWEGFSKDSHLQDRQRESSGSHFFLPTEHLKTGLEKEKQPTYTHNPSPSASIFSLYVALTLGFHGAISKQQNSLKPNTPLHCSFGLSLHYPLGASSCSARVSFPSLTLTQTGIMWGRH